MPEKVLMESPNMEMYCIRDHSTLPIWFTAQFFSISEKISENSMMMSFAAMEC